MKDLKAALDAGRYLLGFSCFAVADVTLAATIPGVPPLVPALAQNSVPELTGFSALNFVAGFTTLAYPAIVDQCEQVFGSRQSSSKEPSPSVMSERSKSNLERSLSSEHELRR